MRKVLIALVILALVTLACGEDTSTIPPRTERPTEETEALPPPPLETDEPTDEPTDELTDEPTEEPTEEPADEPTENPTEEPPPPTEEPTGEPPPPTEEPTEEPPPPTEDPTEEPPPTEEPIAPPTEPVVLTEVNGAGGTVTDNYDWPACQKAVFYWSVSPTSYGSASLIVHLHNVATARDMSLVNEFESDVPGGIQGAAIQALAGGEYFFSVENTDEAWSIRVECQDGAAPVASGTLSVQGSETTVTGNYALPSCTKSIFTWSVEPNSHGTAAIIAHLCNTAMTHCPSVINEFEMDLTEPLTGESLESISEDEYFLVISNTGTRSWSIEWSCED